MIFGLGAALGWGLADLFAAFSARRIGWWSTVVLAHLASAVVMAVVLLIGGPSFDGMGGVAPWVTANTVLVVGAYVTLYRALEIGRIAVISPVLASYAVIPVLLAVAFLDEALSTVQALGVSVTILGAVLTSTDVGALREGTRSVPRGLAWAVLSAVLFGVATFTIAWASQEASALPVLWLVRTASAAVFGAAALAVRFRRGHAFGGALPFGALAVPLALGSVDVAGTLSYAVGAEMGLVSVVSAVSATYPLIPVFGGIRLFGERPSPIQYLGVASVVAGLALLGSA